MRAGFLGFLLLASCTTTQTLSVKEMRSISDGRKHEAIVLRATDGTSVRIDPNTSIRFTGPGGAQTEWYSARELEVGELGVIVQKKNAMHRMTWDEIQGIDARNLSGSKSLALVIGSAAVVAVIAAAATGKKAPRAFVPAVHTARVSVWAVHVAAHDHHHHHHHHHDHDHGPPRESSPASASSVSSDAPRPDESNTESLFEGVVRRRSSVEIVPAVAGYAKLGTSGGFSDPATYAGTVSVVARMAQMAELGFGVERHTASYRFGENDFGRTSQILGFLRGGASFYLDDEHRLAVPVLFDVGFGSSVELQTRIKLGFRVRAFDSFMIGFYPMNPTYTRYRDREHFGDPRWTLPTAIETSFAF